jgi:hypothetical protein
MKILCNCNNYDKIHFEYRLKFLRTCNALNYFLYILKQVGEIWTALFMHCELALFIKAVIKLIKLYKSENFSIEFRAGRDEISGYITKFSLISYQFCVQCFHKNRQNLVVSAIIFLTEGILYTFHTALRVLCICLSVVCFIQAYFPSGIFLLHAVRIEYKLPRNYT